MNDEMLHAMLESLRRVAEAPDVRVLFVSGEGRAFCAGGDIVSMEGMDETGFRETIHLYMHLTLSGEQIDAAEASTICALLQPFSATMLCQVSANSSL